MIRDATTEPRPVIEDIKAPSEIKRCRDQDSRAPRNSDWLQAHWTTLLPQARGKFIAIAGQEAFIAATADEAWALARAAHPDDDGIISQYVLPGKGPRVYACRR
jgi:hypothetical protein